MAVRKTLRKLAWSPALVRVSQRVQEWRLARDFDPAPATDEDGLPLPPPFYMTMVGGRLRWDGFLMAGEREVRAFADAVDRNGGDFANAKRLLDLGCGCGRMARHYPKFTNAEIFGCDYNRRLATWCQKNLPGTYFVNHLTPPLDVADEDFDLILLYSVFTHMRAETQALWLSELHRITAPGGYCVISIQDEDHINLAAAGLTPEQVQKDEFCIHNDTFEGSNRIATCQSREQVRKSFSRWFSVLDFVPGQPDSTDQTLVVLQKPAGS